jgi:hypothetical protein
MATPNRDDILALRELLDRLERGASKPKEVALPAAGVDHLRNVFARRLGRVVTWSVEDWTYLDPD